MDFPSLLAQKQKSGELPPKEAAEVSSLLGAFRPALVEGGRPADTYDVYLNQFLELSCQQLHRPHDFGYYHEKVRAPVDCYHIGVTLSDALLDKSRSSFLGREPLDAMTAQLKAGENVILFGNHQAELDPHILSALLQKDYPKIAEDVIFVAGHRVTTDPAAIPFSMGRNLLCIHSKRHIDFPPEQKEAKLRHNQRTMQAMRDLLAEGGHCIYVAPSGGRDRPDANGEVRVAPFDPAALEMFLLMARKAGKTTHFYPLALVTYALMPPPDTIVKELGELRHSRYAPGHAVFGAELDMEVYPGSDLADKHARRQARADHIQGLVEAAYESVDGVGVANTHRIKKMDSMD